MCGTLSQKNKLDMAGEINFGPRRNQGQYIEFIDHWRNQIIK